MKSIKQFFQNKENIKLFIGLSFLVIVTFFVINNYILFHVLNELFIIIVSFGVLFISINSITITKNNFFSFLGISIAVSQIFNIIHLFSHRTINVFTEFTGVNLSDFFFIMNKYFIGIALLISIIFLYKKANHFLISGIYFICSVLFMGIILFYRAIPDMTKNIFLNLNSMFVNEIVVTIIYGMFLFFLIRNKNKSDKNSFLFISLFGCGLLLSQLFYLFSLEFNNDFIYMANLTRFISFYFLYRTIIETSFNAPIKSIFYELDEEKNKLQKFLEIAEVIIIVTDAKGTIELINNKGLTLLGYRLEELKNKSLFELFIKEDEQDNFIEIYTEFVYKQKATLTKFESNVVTKNGFKKLVQWNISKVCDDNQNTKYIICSGEDITEKKELEKQLEYYATTDTLTGVFNRRTGLAFLEKSLQLSKREKYELTVCFLDIDELKKVNDLYGHEEGDYLIQTISSIIKDSLRESDLIARFGGDEFLIIFPKCNLENAQFIMSRIQDNISKVNQKSDRLYKLRISYGFAEYNTYNQRTVEELIGISDYEMYQHKKKNKRGI